MVPEKNAVVWIEEASKRYSGSGMGEDITWICESRVAT